MLVYDGSYQGFLSAVFYTFKKGMDEHTIIKRENKATSLLFEEIVDIHTRPDQADRVHNGLVKLLSRAQYIRFVKVFNNDQDEVEQLLLQFCFLVFKHNINPADYSHPVMLEMSQIERSINREKHRMEAFVRFGQLKDGTYLSVIEPDFNVLPFISDHFQNRYGDQKWIIYDFRRKYGLYYNLQEVEIIHIDFKSTINPLNGSDAIYTGDEQHFRELWQTYFDHVNIKSRANQKLHVQHVPKRYWKFLSEKYRYKNG